MKFSFTHNTLIFEGNDIVQNSIPSFLSTYNFPEVNTIISPGLFKVKINNIKEIMSFPEYMKSQKYLLDYNSAMMLFYKMNELASTLKQHGLYIPVVHVKDFVVMSDGEKVWFVYVGLSEKTIFRAIDGDIIVPLNVDTVGSFFSPELKIKRLPLKVPDPYGCTIYAIGMLVKACICGDTEGNMDEIYASKLYWAIKRAIEERIYLII
jgi:hypothetical protein